MGPLDAFWHLTNLFAVPVALGALAGALAKLTWRRELAAVPWRRLAGPASIACALTVLAGMAIFGRDGRMATYAGTVVVCAVTLWWQGFGPGRR